MGFRLFQPRRVTEAAVCLCVAAGAAANAQSATQVSLPEAPSALLASRAYPAAMLATEPVSSSAVDLGAQTSVTSQTLQNPAQRPKDQEDKNHGEPGPQAGKPLPQQQRMFGVLPNFQSVSAGITPPRAGWKTDFRIANRQNYDYTSIGFLLVTSGIAYGENSHPALAVVNGGDAVFWAYLWRGFLDKTDGTYQGAFFFPALLHEDTRYYAMGTGSVSRRTLHAIASVVVAHNYDQRPIFNVAGLAGKVGAQAVSRTYYPANSEDFGVLASKFAYSCMRQAGFAVLREFSPDLNVHLHHHHAVQTTATP